MTVRCANCGDEWERDPALEVACPQCGAKVGCKCKRPSQHGVWGGQPHASRDQAAMDAGFLRPCLAGHAQRVLDERAKVQQMSLF
jgi:DNA-directed RNA polymerase subunit RPC12/RpoP